MESLSLNSTYLVLWILFAHWVADFLFQTDKMALGKSDNWSDLIDHTATYSVAMWILLPNIGILASLAFFFVTFVFHTTQDYFTSRLNKKLWAENKRHWFFVSVGFDQFLHFAQLLITYSLLTN